MALGSNVGDRQAHLELARQGLAQLPRTTLTAMSGVYETEPAGPIPQDPYLNAVAELQTQLTVQELLEHLRAIEARAGRPEPGQRVKWGPRTLDLDILLYGNQVVSDDELVVPHPLMHERRFVLEPLAELDPNVVHPLLEMTVGDLLKYLDDPAASDSEH